MNQPLVSVIIPTFNRAHLIGETLDSVLAQTYQNWECIIVDDGSSDNTDKVVNKYVQKDDRFKYYHRPDEHLPGGNGARNYGFKMSKGDYIQWFDSDDIFRADYLDEKIKHHNYDAIVSPMLKFNKSPENIILSSKNNIFSNDIIKDYITGKVTFYVSGVLWKKDFLQKSDEVFDEEISNMDDWDYNLRLIYKKPNLFYMEEPYSLYRIHNASLYRKMKLHKDNKEIYSDLKARRKHIKIIIDKYPKYLSMILRFTDCRYLYFLKIIHGLSKSDSLNLIFDHMRFKLKYNLYSNFGNLLLYSLIITLTNKGFYILKRL